MSEAQKLIDNRLSEAKFPRDAKFRTQCDTALNGEELAETPADGMEYWSTLIDVMESEYGNAMDCLDEFQDLEESDLKLLGSAIKTLKKWRAHMAKEFA